MKRYFMFCVLGVVSLSAYLQAEGSITGYGQFEKIAGKPSMGHVQLYEWDLYLVPEDNTMVGPFRRLGAPPGQTPTGNGYYRIDNVPAGNYTVYVNQPDFFASPKVIPNVQIIDGQTTNLNVDLDVDYSTYYKDGGQWTDWQSDWYQTFMATGTSIRGVSWMMAGWGAYNGKKATIKILEDNGEADIRNWKEVGYGTDNNLSSDSDEWVRWPSGQVPITPGRMYAVDIYIKEGMAVYRRNKDSNSYSHGRAYDLNGNPQNFDLNVTVFVDKNDQAVTHTRTGSGPGNLYSTGGTGFGQTFVAKGWALAAVDLFAASGQSDTTLTWKIKKDGPNGQQVGPVKTVKGAYYAASTDLCGVAYNPGQVPLIPGQIYYIEITSPSGFTPFTQEAWMTYPDGQAYKAGNPINNDLAMTIIEYENIPKKGLVGLWKMDEGAGNIVNDSSGNNYNGFYPSEQWSGDGKFGNALLLNGDNSLKIPGYKGVYGGLSRTCAAWIKTSQEYGDIFYWGKKGLPGRKWRLRITAGGLLRLEVYGGVMIGSTPVNTGRWEHIAVALPDDSTRIKDVVMYINGKPEPADQIIFGDNEVNTASYDKVQIGSNGETFFTGLIDEVAVFDVALTDQEVSRLIHLGGDTFLEPCGSVFYSYDIGAGPSTDFNRDCVVNLDDLLVLSGFWLEPDINFMDMSGSDNKVTLPDFAVFSEQW